MIEFILPEYNGSERQDTRDGIYVIDGHECPNLKSLVIQNGIVQYPPPVRIIVLVSYKVGETPHGAMHLN